MILKPGNEDYGMARVRLGPGGFGRSVVRS